MFKAKLINDKKYYKYRGLLIIMITLPPIVLSFLTSFARFPAWALISIVVVYIILMILSLRFTKKMGTMIGKEIIEIDNNEIRVRVKKSNKKETIPITSIDKIILKKVYSFAHESMTDIAKELNGNSKKNYIILQNGNENRRFDFEVDSYYMINQLNKIICYWDEAGYKIERIINK